MLARSPSVAPCGSDTSVVSVPVSSDSVARSLESMLVSHTRTEISNSRDPLSVGVIDRLSTETVFSSSPSLSSFPPLSSSPSVLSASVSLRSSVIGLSSSDALTVNETLASLDWVPLTTVSVPTLES